jgi:uncharacterized protein YjbK
MMKIAPTAINSSDEFLISTNDFANFNYYLADDAFVLRRRLRSLDTSFT